ADAAARFPDRDVFVFHRARSAYFRKDYPAALAFYGQYAEENEDRASASANHAWALGANGRVEEAVAAATAAFDAVDEDDEDDGDVAVESGFYHYALVQPAEQPARLA